MNDGFEEWYRREDVMYELVKQLKGRETSFLSKEIFIRCMKAHCIKFLQQNMKRFNFIKHQCNLYRSVAYLQDMPMFSFNPLQRREQQYWFIDNFNKYIKDYDFVVDFDGHDSFDTCKKEASELKDVFDMFKLPYALIFSGSGFHFEVEGKYLDLIETEPLEKVKICHHTAQVLSNIMFFKTMDTGIYDVRRIWKICFSMDYKTNRIAMPLTDKQFEHFNMDLVNPRKIKSVKNMGLLTRNLNLGEQKLKQNVKDFYEEIIV